MTLVAALLPEPGRCYIVGPVSLKPDANRPAFAAAERRLRALGWDPANPTKLRSSKTVKAESDRLIAIGGDYSQGPLYMRHMRTCFRRVLQSRAIFALSGWHTSPNARFEINLAQRAGIPVFEYETGVPIVR